MAEWRKRLIAQMGRPAAYLKDGGSDRQKAAALLEDDGLGHPCLDDISHAAAGLLKRTYTPIRPSSALCRLVAGPRGTQAHAPGVRGAAHRADQGPLHECPPLSHLGRPCPPAVATGRRPARLHVSQLGDALDGLPDCTALIKRFQGDAGGLLACQAMRKTRGLGKATVAECEARIHAMPTAAIRQEFRAYLHALETAEALGLDHVGMPIRSDTIESLFGVGKRHGVGEISMRLASPFDCRRCAGRRREEPAQVLGVRVARQHEFTEAMTSLTQQRREGLSHAVGLESLRREPHSLHWEPSRVPKSGKEMRYVFISKRFMKITMDSICTRG